MISFQFLFNQGKVILSPDSFSYFQGLRFLSSSLINKDWSKEESSLPSRVPCYHGTHFSKHCIDLFPRFPFDINILEEAFLVVLDLPSQILFQVSLNLPCGIPVFLNSSHVAWVLYKFHRFSSIWVFPWAFCSFMGVSCYLCLISYS